MSTYKVRIWTIREHTSRAAAASGGKARSTYRVRWTVTGKEFGESFATRPLAEGFRSKLIVAQREGTAFDEVLGLPMPMAREARSRTWYEHAVAFVDMKWPRASAKHRRSIAESLATGTPALLATTRGAPDAQTIRDAMYRWALNKAHREAGPPSADLAPAVRWLETNTVKLTDIGSDAAVVRKALDLLALRLDGKAAAPNTVARKRAVFYGALAYAVELRLLDANPIDYVRWKLPPTDDTVDRRVVINHTQARALLAAVRAIEPNLEAFFGCMYYAALRPAEVLHLRLPDCELPERGWGRLHLAGSNQHAGSDWTDSGEAREDHGLKHRSVNESRPVPAVSPLVQLLRRHVEQFGTGRDGLLFPARGFRQGPVSIATYLRVWRQARASVLGDEHRSPLARRPYDLRHAAVSTWLNAGVPATLVAEWAGNSVEVLLRVYAKCIDGQDEAARNRIEAALGLPSEEESEPAAEVGERDRAKADDHTSTVDVNHRSDEPPGELDHERLRI